MKEKQIKEGLFRLWVVIAVLLSSCGNPADEMIEVHDHYNFDKLENPKTAVVRVGDFEWIKTSNSKVYLGRSGSWTPSTEEGNKAVREYNLSINYEQPYHPD